MSPCLIRRAECGLIELAPVASILPEVWRPICIGDRGGGKSDPEGETDRVRGRKCGRTVQGVVHRENVGGDVGGAEER